MNFKLIKDLLQSRLNLQLSLFLKAYIEKNENEKIKIKAVIEEIKEIAKPLNIELNSTIQGTYNIEV
jgi:hypothetical protein